MKNTIQNFNTKNFYEASVQLFQKLSIPLDSITELSIDPNDIFETPKPFFDKIKDIYTLGMVSDNLFDGQKSEFNIKNKKDYEAILIFSVELNESKPTRSLLSDIARSFNREYHYTPVIVLFKYDDKLSLANTQRQNYKINKEGEKAGKVTILRDINISNPHTGHIKILNDMKISSKIKTYDELYKHWQEVFDVSILNKAFYKELQNWYFYAINEVVYPNEPKATDDIDKLKEYRAKNVIRLLTRLLFVWFIKEKGLVPNELFEEDEIKKLIKDFEPKKQDQETLFGGHDKESRYYKAILQNLFFATLNQEMGQRAFRIDGRNQNTTNLMRYKKYFREAKDFIELVESVVPFMNGGLFECLDAPHPTKKGRQGEDIIVYEDGFSDRTDNPLIVPDYIFFGHENHVDLSVEYGSKNKAFKDASVKGLINILKSYKFTIAENTPIEEDVALDPELLGKVFENLLASYNPETKTTARKQTGSFYTPREIVSYMVDESLIAYLKTKLDDEFEDKDELDTKLHQLLAFDNNNPFSDNESFTKKIIDAIDEVKILDPAVGSGAFPMGALQKMVHLLSKLDPSNEYWQDLQLKKAQDETNDAFKSGDKNSIKEKVDEIFESFDESINNPDYARKLYLIENTIFGVDIQPIAIQISKLRFFISLVVEQNINNDKENFGIRPLPNLESKFVAANTLIGLEIEQQNLFDRTNIKELETELQDIRHKIFNAKTPKTKRKYRKLDSEIREKIKQALLNNGVGNNTAEQLSSWDPYDQNSSSPFFDMEWMFGIEDGFDIVIGNPPYLNVEKIDQNIKNNISVFKTAYQKYDLYVLFYEQGLNFLNQRGVLNYITSNKFLSQGYGLKLREKFLKNTINIIVNFNYDVFEAATVRTCVFQVVKKPPVMNNSIKIIDVDSIKDKEKFDLEQYSYLQQDIFNSTDQYNFRLNLTNDKLDLIAKIETNTFRVDDICSVNYGLRPSSEILKLKKEAFIFDSNPENIYKKYFEGKDMGYWSIKNSSFLHYRPDVMYNPMFTELFEFEKLVGLRTLSDIGKLRFIYDNKGFYCNDSVVVLSLWHKLTSIDYSTIKRTITQDRIKTSENFSYSYLQGILNSKLIKFYFNELLYDGTHFYPNHMKQLPIKNISPTEQLTLIYLVETIRQIDSEKQCTKTLEQELNQTVYKLYGLTENEIKIVEDSIK